MYTENGFWKAEYIDQFRDERGRVHSVKLLKDIWGKIRISPWHNLVFLGFIDNFFEKWK